MKRQAAIRRIALGVVLTFCGCAPSKEPVKEPIASSPTVTLYCSVDETFARQIVDHYEATTGRHVLLVSDTEAGKTTGLVNKLRLEKDRPRADVFWSSEQSQTVLLAREGLWAAYESPAAKDIPNSFKDAKHRWTGYALRARVLAYDPQKLKPADLPKTWVQLAEPRFAKRLAIANPLFGTTRGHVASMEALWGPARFEAFLKQLVEGGVLVTGGNSSAVRKLMAGDVDYAATDSDDVLVAQRKGASVAMIFPDMNPDGGGDGDSDGGGSSGGGGTLLIPNTVALVAGGPHPEEAKQLIDFLLSSEVEEMLAHSASGNYPVRPALRTKLGISLPPASHVSYDAIADHMPSAIKTCREILLH